MAYIGIMPIHVLVAFTTHPTVLYVFLYIQCRVYYSVSGNIVLMKPA